MEKVENDQFVQVEYQGTLNNGDVFDSSNGRRPLEFQMGAGQMIKGFEAAVLGMSLNEKKSIALEPEDAYGHRDEELTRVFERSEVPPGMNPEVGQTISLSTPDGRQIPARIFDLDDEKITLDLNHPLAGESLNFDIEVVGITDAPTQQHGCGSGCDCSGGQSQQHGCGSGCDCS
ncbi:MAG: peptidylprolyl isomerase [Deltaproteobacteria bacterium]|nr:peptidylprolyl isomerase [Deltaproteobacteria bacterium]